MLEGMNGCQHYIDMFSKYSNLILALKEPHGAHLFILSWIGGGRVETLVSTVLNWKPGPLLLGHAT